MTDFLERFGEQLAAAVPPDEFPHLNPSGSDAPRRRFWRTSFRRAALVGAVTVAIAAPALAVLSPWSPSLNRPGVDQPVSSDATPLSPVMLQQFGILRRDQTAADRDQSAPLLPAIGAGNQLDKIQTDGIRSPAHGWAVVPARTVQTGPGQRVDEDVLCLTNGDAVACSPVSLGLKNGVALTSASKSGTRIAGFVPDAVATVRFTPAGGNAVVAEVTSNFFLIDSSELGAAGPIDASPVDGPTQVPGPPMPTGGTLERLDDAGNVVGPADKSFG